MALRSVLTTLALSTLLAAPAGADQHERRRPHDSSKQVEQSDTAASDAAPRDRAVARRAPAPSREDLQRRDVQAPAVAEPRAAQSRPSTNNRYEGSRASNNNGRYDGNRYDNRSDNRSDNRYDNRYDNRHENRGYGYGSRRYDSHSHYYYYYAAPRYIHPTVVHVVPYQPYVYRPSYSVGVYYGSGGYYPYGYTPRGYYEPIPGRVYGGLRITGAPRDARVFADGYFVGLVDDFDGIFQHLNLEAGPHHIELDWGYQPMAFDVYVQPGQTTTFRAGY